MSSTCLSNRWNFDCAPVEVRLAPPHLSTVELFVLDLLFDS